MELTPRRRAQYFRRHRSRRGTAVFIVMMSLMVLTSIGLWAMHSAGVTDAASGHSRAAAQTLYLGELGMTTAATYFSVPGYAGAGIQQAKADLGADPPTTDDCQSAAANTFCKAYEMEDLDDTIQDETAGFAAAPYYILDELGTDGGSLSAHAVNETLGTGIQGNFVIEMTDERLAIVQGNDLNSGNDNGTTYRMVTLTSYGISGPPGVNNCAVAVDLNPSGTSAVASQVSMRAHMVVGPL